MMDSGPLAPHLANILLVDDRSENLLALEASLEGLRARFFRAGSGQEALAHLLKHEFAVILLDVQMAGMDGYETASLIRQRRSTRHTPIIFLTAADRTDTHALRGYEAGAVDYLFKPINPTVVRSKVAVFIELAEQAALIKRQAEELAGREAEARDLVATLEEKNRSLEALKAEITRHASSLEERLRNVLDTVPDVLFSMSPSGDMLYVSPGSSKVLGCSPEECVRTPMFWLERIAAEDVPRFVTSRELAAASGQPQSVEYRFRHPEQGMRYVQTRYVPVVDREGRVTRLDGVSRDVTQQRQLEEQLRISQKMEAVGTLAGGIAHDFNNQLAAILSSADLALMDLNEHHPVHQEVIQIREVATRSAALTRQLLAFSRKQVLQPHPISLNDLARTLTTMLRRLIGEHIQLDLRLSTDPTNVLGDPSQVEQVLMNLCVNARDAMPGGGQLTIATDRIALDESFCVLHPWARAGDYVRLTVSDTGVGMDPATQARIFEPFFTTKEAGRGTGLGLAVVYGIVRQHGGFIHVYSEPGSGATFRIYLPRHGGPVEGQANKGPTAAQGGTERILLAEDEDALRTAASRMLTRLGYSVLAAANGREAVEILKTQGDTLQLAILDVMMPGMGGPEVFEHIRRDHPNLRVLFTTGYVPGAQPAASVQALSTGVLPKPYGMHDLSHAVRAALAASPGPAGPHRTAEAPAPPR